jgi:hypothetical protein
MSATAALRLRGRGVGGTHTRLVGRPLVASHVFPADPLLARRITNGLKKNSGHRAFLAANSHPTHHTTPPAYPASETS